MTNKQALREAAEKANPEQYGFYLVDAFTELATPAAVLALLDELEAAEKRVADLSSAVIAPGIMRCAECGFVLTKNSINMAAGTITAGDSKTEPCPNGCGPLWPVTWKEQALEMRDSSEQWFEELLSARQRIAELEAREVTLPQVLDVHPLGPQSAKMFWEFKRDVVNECADRIRAAGIRINGEG